MLKSAVCIPLSLMPQGNEESQVCKPFSNQSHLKGMLGWKRDLTQTCDCGSWIEAHVCHLDRKTLLHPSMASLLKPLFLPIRYANSGHVHSFPRNGMWQWCTKITNYINSLGDSGNLHNGMVPWAPKHAGMRLMMDFCEDSWFFDQTRFSFGPSQKVELFLLRN